MSGKSQQPNLDSIMANPLMKKPSLEEVGLEATRQGLPSSEAEKFYWYYEANGWRVGKNPMRSWRAALSGWRVRWQEKCGTPAEPRPAVSGRPLTILDLKTVLQTKLSLAAEIKMRYSAEVPFGLHWRDDAKRGEYIQIRKEAKALEQQLANMA